MADLADNMQAMRLTDGAGARGGAEGRFARGGGGGGDRRTAAEAAAAAAIDAAVEAQIDHSAPPSSDGGFRALSTLDVLPIDRLLPTIVQRVKREPLTVLQAATGSGKSSRVPAAIMREWYAPHRVAERATQRQAFAASLRAQGVDCSSETSYPPSLRQHPLILCTQPRRIAAISLAKRVSSELGEECGQSVGFKIGHESMADRRTRLLFVTTGWLLQKLVHNPAWLAECSHIVLDEIHELSLDSDILYVVLRRVIRALVSFDLEHRRPHGQASYPSLVLMSATFSTGLFANYFGPVWKSVPGMGHYARPQDLQAVQIDTRRYPVTIFHLERILDAPLLKANRRMLSRLLPDNPASIINALVPKMSKPPPPGAGAVALGPVSNSLLNLISWLCAALALCQRSDPDEGCCILVFFPGLQEIEAAAQIIDESLLRSSYTQKIRVVEDAQGRPVEEEVFDSDDEDDGGDDSYAGWRRSGAPPRAAPPGIEVRQSPMAELVELMILHSVVDDQLKVFEPVRAGHTRVVLATNIAESSVTIPHVKFVLDLGAHKEVSFSPRFNCEMLVKTWISQASAKQRAGRCGRLSPGTVFRLYPECVYTNPAIMPPYDVPELLRVSLASTILRLKMTAADREEDEEEDKEDSAAAAKRGRGGAASSASAPRFDPSVCNLNDPHAVLSECMQPPDLASIDAAYEELLKNGAVQLSKDGVNARVKDVTRFQSSVPGAEGKGQPRTTRLDGFASGLSLDEKRAIYQRSVMTPLGRFFAALPFSFHLSRLVALGVVFGPKFLVHSVVIAAALSTQEVFVMPMQSRAAQGGGGDRRDRRDDDFPLFVARTTRTRVWCDAGTGSDAIAIVRLVDAYLKYRQHVQDQFAGGSAVGLGRKSYVLDEWCSQRGVHMKRIKTLVSSIAEIALRLSGLVHQDAEREALLQLAAMCGKTKARAAPTRGGYGGSGASSRTQSKKHYTYANSRAAAADRDSDRGNSAHNDLFHLLRQAHGDKAPAGSAGDYDFRQDILTTAEVPDDLLAIDPEVVTVLQFMLASALLPNLLMGSATPAQLGEGLPCRGEVGQPGRLDPANTLVIEKVPAPLLSSREEKLQHRSEFAEVNNSFTHVLIANDGGGGKKKGKNNREPQEPCGSMAMEFSETQIDWFTRMRVALDGRPAAHLSQSSKDNAQVAVLALPTLEMLTLSRMFAGAGGKFNVMLKDRGVDGQAGFGHGGGSSQFQSQAYQQQQMQMQQVSALQTLSDCKLPGKAIKWRLFSPRSPARLDALSPISSLTAYMLPARALRSGGGFSDYDPSAPTPDPLLPPRTGPAQQAAAAAAAASGRGGKKGGKGKKGKLSRKEESALQLAEMKAAAASQISATNKSEFTVWAVAASMMVSSGASNEIRAEKVTLLPVGANAAVTSVMLALLLPGELVQQGGLLIGVRFEGVTLHFTATLDAALEPALLRMRDLMTSLLNEEFVTSDTRAVAPLFLQLVRPLMRSAIKSYPSTDPVGFVRRPKLNLLPPSNPRPDALTSSSAAAASSRAAAAGPSDRERERDSWRASAAAPARQGPSAAVGDAEQQYLEGRALILQRKKEREAANEAALASAAAARPASAAAPARTSKPSDGALVPATARIVPRNHASAEAAAPAPAAAAAAPSSSGPPSAAAQAAAALAAELAAVPAATERMRVVRSRLVKEQEQAPAAAPQAKQPKQQQPKPDKAAAIAAAFENPDYVPESWDDEPVKGAGGKQKGKKNNAQQAASAPAAAAAPAGLLDPSTLLSSVTRAVSSSRGGSLTLNDLCVALAKEHGGATWKTLAGPKLSMKDYVARHKGAFTVQVDKQTNETHISINKGPQPQQQAAAPAAAAAAAQPKAQQQQQAQRNQQQAGGGGGGNGGGRVRSKKPQGGGN